MKPWTRAIFSERKSVTDCFSSGLIEGRTWDAFLSSDRIVGFNFHKVPLFIEVLLSMGNPKGYFGPLKPGGNRDQFLGKYLSMLENVEVSNLKENEILLLGLSPLVGVGIGFTPSRVDFLAGVFLGE